MLAAVVVAQAPSPHLTASRLLQNAEAYLVSPAALPADASAFAGEGSIQLYHLRYEQVVPCGLSALLVQRVFQIRTREAADFFVPDNLWYDSTRGEFHLLRALVWRRPGHGPYRVIAHGRDLGNLPGFSPGTQPRRIHLPALRPGDRVSLVYAVLPDTSQNWSALQGHFIGNLFAFRDSFSTARVRYVLAAHQPMAVSAAGLPAPMHQVLAGGRQTWQWEAKDQPAFFQSTDGPAITDVSPFVQVSSFATWPAMAHWYAALLAERSKLSPQLDAQLRAIAAPGATRPDLAQTRAIVARVWQYLSDHLTYRGDEEGVHAYVPAPVGEVFRHGAGDCKDGALLLATWLRSVGVEADLALVRTPAMGPVAPPNAAGQVAATMAAFDHALVYIPLTGQWIDTTAPHRLDTELPTGDQNSLALILGADQQTLVRVPAARALANLTRSDIQLSPAPAGGFTAVGSFDVRGAGAPELRQRYAQPAARRGDLQNWLRAEFPGATVTTLSVAGIQPAAPVVSIHFRAYIPPQQLRVGWLPDSYLQQLSSQVNRRQPLELPVRWEQDQTWSLALPAGQFCPSLSAPVRRAGGRFGQVAVSISCRGGSLQVHAQVRQTASQVMPGEYPAFRSFWQSVDALLHRPVALPSRRAVTVALDERR
ncbi:MAG: DUF3857 domain-containing protein [Terriglobales bacterium]